MARASGGGGGSNNGGCLTPLSFNPSIISQTKKIQKFYLTNSSNKLVFQAVIAKQKLSEVRLFDKLEPLHDRIWSMNLEIEQIEQEESMGFVHPDEVTELKAENDELKQNVFLAEQSMYELKDAFEEMQTKFHQNQEG